MIRIDPFSDIFAVVRKFIFENQSHCSAVSLRCLAIASNLAIFTLIEIALSIHRLAKTPFRSMNFDLRCLNSDVADFCYLVYRFFLKLLRTRAALYYDGKLWESIEHDGNLLLYAELAPRCTADLIDYVFLLRDGLSPYPCPGHTLRSRWPSSSL